MQIFSGKSNPDLAKKIAELMGSNKGLDLGKVEISRFENDEARVRVTEPRVESEAILVQSLSQPVDQNLVEFCLLADSLIRKGVTNLTGVIPWMGYSKQDKVFLPGEALSAKVAAQILQTTKVKKIITFDLHNRAILGFFDIPVTELSAKPLFLEYFQNREKDKLRIVAPDEGAVKASSYFARELNVPMVYMDKRRDLTTGKVEVVGMSGNVKGAELIMIDDMIVTGSTSRETAKYLKERGATKVVVAATHHLQVPGVQELLEQSEIDEIVVTDTIQERGKAELGKRQSKLKVLSVAPLIVDELTK